MVLQPAALAGPLSRDEAQAANPGLDRSIRRRVGW